MKNNEFIRGKVPITKEEVRAISLNKLNLKNKNKLISGVFYYSDNKVKLGSVSDGKYCANGYINNLVITDGSCIYDNTPPEINLDKTSSDWENEIDLKISVSDISGIKEFKYKIVPKYDDQNNFEWINVNDDSTNINLSTPGVYNIYVSSTDMKNNIKNAMFGEYKVFEYDNYKIWLEYLNENSSGYNSIEQLFNDTEMFKKMISSDRGVEYLKNSTINIMATILNNTDAMNKVIDNRLSLMMIANDNIWFNALKGNENYSSIYVNSILKTTSLSNDEKYQYSLPCYIYNYGDYYLISTFANYIGPSNGSQNHSFSNTIDNGLYFYASGASDSSEQYGAYFTDKKLTGENLQKYSKIGSIYYYEENLADEDGYLGLFYGGPANETWAGYLPGVAASIQFSAGTHTAYISIPKLNSSLSYGLYLRLDTNKYQLSGNYYVKSYVRSLWLE